MMVLHHRAPLKGFTLLELLIVISIVGILASVAVPSFKSSLTKNKRSAESENIIRDINIARSEAIKRGQRVVLCTGDTSGCNNSTNWTNGWIAFVDEDKNNNKGSSEQILRIGELKSPNFTLIGSTDIAHAIKFQADGLAIATGTLTLCNGDDTNTAKALILSTSGKPKISDTAAGGAELACP